MIVDYIKSILESFEEAAIPDVLKSIKDAHEELESLHGKILVENIGSTILYRNGAKCKEFTVSFIKPGNIVTNTPRQLFQLHWIKPAIGKAESGKPIIATWKDRLVD